MNWQLTDACQAADRDIPARAILRSPAATRTTGASRGRADGSSREKGQTFPPPGARPESRSNPRTLPLKHYTPGFFMASSRGRSSCAGSAGSPEAHSAGVSRAPWLWRGQSGRAAHLSQILQLTKEVREPREDCDPDKGLPSPA